MRQKLLKFTTHSAALLAVLTAGGIVTAAQAETFATRWVTFDPAPKGDRLDTPAAANASSVVFYNDPRAALTIVTKIEASVKNESSTRKIIREVPNENVRQDKQKKPLVGCEPSFSPVTTPSMANVTGRCLAARDAATKVAGLAR